MASRKMDQKKHTNKRKIRSAVISIVIGVIIVWFLLSKIDPRDIPRAIGNIPLQNLVVAFLLYTTSVFLKAVRFRIILRTGISLRQIFPIVSLYMFLADILPLRTGELSYMYLLKKEANTPGTKSLASLIIGGVSDAIVFMIATFIVVWHFRDRLIGLWAHRLIGSWTYKSIYLLAYMPIALLAVGLFILIKRKWISTQFRTRRYLSFIKMKLLEVVREVTNVTPDIRLLGIFVSSVLIMLFRFGTQWYLVRFMEIAIGIWEFFLALLFGLLFSLVPIHGPAGFGTVEAPWVLALVYLNIPKEDAITSGFSLHIIILLFCIILGLYGIVALRKSGRLKE